ncbi:hypothetical protein PIB30_045375 [Stylosanthes scabra]|uniref:Uncharacterized protein n=1 Tax=Stylosanthes scabra TaxID=79078 RepID=A0ABU6TFX6_9FABA|nr:hypothetical protein [Stylosanthes scabra]
MATTRPLVSAPGSNMSQHAKLYAGQRLMPDEFLVNSKVAALLFASKENQHGHHSQPEEDGSASVSEVQTSSPNQPSATLPTPTPLPMHVEVVLDSEEDNSSGGLTTPASIGRRILSSSMPRHIASAPSKRSKGSAGSKTPWRFLAENPTKEIQGHIEYGSQQGRYSTL